MTTKELQTEMSKLYKDTSLPRTKLIATAVQLGMDYQESKIKEGINIVFNTLHK